MGAYNYNDLSKFLPQKVVQANIYFVGGSVNDLFAITQLAEGSNLTIDPITESSDNGSSRTVAYSINCVFQFMQNDFPSYQLLITRIAENYDILTSWTCYLKFDDYDRQIACTGGPFSVPTITPLHNIEQSFVDTGEGIMQEIRITTIISKNDIDQVFYNV